MIYLDYHATTPPDPEVVVGLEMVWGNPASEHRIGAEARRLVASAAEEVLRFTGGERVIFTSGATEALNQAIQSVTGSTQRRPVRVATSVVEHAAVLEPLRRLERQGFVEVHWIRVDARGGIRFEEIVEAVDAGADVLIVMAANNEIGNLYPTHKIAEVAAANGVPYICDTTQVFGRVPFDLRGLPGQVYAVLSGHKMYGPRGIGALVTSGGAPLAPLILGGGQQEGLRGGTLNVPGIVGLGRACRRCNELLATEGKRVRALRDELYELLRRGIPSLVLVGEADFDARLPGNLTVSVPGVPNQVIIGRLRDRVAISTGSACHEGTVGPSHVIRALGLEPKLAEGVLRFGLGRFTTEAEVREAAELVAATVAEVRDLVA